MKKYFIYMLMTIISSSVYSQLSKDSLLIDSIRPQNKSLMMANNRSLEMPEHRETVHSPQVALMNQFGDYPVDLSNGLVDISIPLYGIQTTKLSMPLVLKFHPSGLRHDERESFLGIRWALGGLGQISRVIKGYPDEYYYPLHESINNPDYRPDFFALYGTTSTMYKSSGGTYNSVFNTMGGQYKDTEYDIYSYTLPSGKSGKFIITETNGIGIVNLMPYEPIKITIGTAEGNIVDDDGTIYQFKRLESSGNGTTAWHLTKIISADKQDVIFIDYIHSNLETSMWSGNIVMSHSLYDNSPYAYNAPYGSSLYNLFSSIFNSQDTYFNTNSYARQIHGDKYTISSIQAESNGKLLTRVKFDYALTQTNSTKYLEKISVQNAESKIVQQIDFTLKDNLSKKFKLLDKIEFKSPLSNEKQLYTFDYYDSPVVPACRDLSKNFDWWGYYSASAGEFYAQYITLKIPTKIVGIDGEYTTVRMDGGNKAPNESSMKVGMIKKITYPTGGQTELIYESNKAGSTSVGGLRIKEIKNNSGSGKTESKYYEYKDATIPYYLLSPGGQFNRIAIQNEIEGYYQPEQRTSPNQDGDFDIGYGKYIQHTYLRNLPPEYTQFQTNIISYGNVTEYFGSSATNNTGKIEYIYNIKHLETSYYKDIRNNIFESSYNNYTHFHVSPADFWKRSNLNSKTIYKSIGNGYNIQYKEVEKYDYAYKSYREKSIYDMPVYRYRYHQVVVVPGYNEKQIEIDLIYPNNTLLSDIFAYVNQRYTTGVEKLVKETKYTYHDNGIQTTTKEFEYDPKYVLPIEEKITNSDASIISTKTRYYFDYKSPETTYMVKQNILTPIFEKQTAKNGKDIERLVYLYNGKYNNKGSIDNIVLGFIDLYKNGEEESLASINYREHDFHALPREVVKNNNEFIVYIRNIYGNVVAEILNARYSTVASTLGGVSVIERISKSYEVSSLDMALLDNLRKDLPEAHVYTYTYRPLVGILTATNPMGITTYYEYNDANKLERIMDAQENTIESYEYNYSN